MISSKTQDALGRDNFVSSTLVSLYYHVWAYYFVQFKQDVADPMAWFNTAADRYAREKTLAALYNRGAWSGAGARIFANCHDQLIETCEMGAHDHVRQVGAYVREMEEQIRAGNCYDEALTLRDVADYVTQLLPMFRQSNETAVRAAAREAFLAASGGAQEARFQRVALDVLSAIESKLEAQVHCPETELNQWYGQWDKHWTCPY